MQSDNKNLLLAIVFSVAILIVFQMFFLPDPPKQQPQGTPTAAGTTTPQGSAPVAPGGGSTGAGTPAAPRTGQPATGKPATAGTPQLRGTTTRQQAIEATKRVRIETPKLTGSIALKGGRIDDLTLVGYRTTIDKSSPDVTLLNPVRAPNAYYIEFGWSASGIKTPDANTEWQANKTVLKPGEPVTLRWDNGEGYIFERVITIDDKYMFSVTQRVRNQDGKPATFFPYGLAKRHGEPETQGFFILHEGPYGVFRPAAGETATQERNSYSDLTDADPDPTRGGVKAKRHQSVGGWIGITDHYWMVALIPDQKQKTSFSFAYIPNGDQYQTDLVATTGLQAARGATVEATTRVFAGAKVVEVINGYEAQFGIARFDLAIDWGWFPFLTKPIFWSLEFFFKLVGNFGVAILLLTVCIKIIFFPLANRSYKAMGKMKLLTPKMQQIRERFKDNKEQQNKELMELYKREKVNPMAGCWPILIQIPVFFALYKVLFVTIEMRHAPFFGWVQDLSARDPTSVLNLFGLLPFEAPMTGIVGMISIGIWPLLMGISMYLQQKLNPPPPDPMQRKIFMMLPIVFTFILAPFAAGLVIYWTWNNVLSIAQQWVIMRRHGQLSQSTVPAAGGPVKKGKQAAIGDDASGGDGGSDGDTGADDDGGAAEAEPEEAKPKRQRAKAEVATTGSNPAARPNRGRNRGSNRRKRKSR